MPKCLICRKYPARTGDLFCWKCAIGDYPAGGLHRRLHPTRRDAAEKPQDARSGKITG